MTISIHQFLHGSLRRKSNMLAKVSILAVIAVVSCGELGYSSKTYHEPTRQYEHNPIRVQEGQEAALQQHYLNSEAAQAYSSQSVIQNTGSDDERGYAPQNENVAPVYQYVQEEAQNQYQRPIYRSQGKIPAQRYQTIHLVPAVEEQRIPEPVSQHETQYFQANEALGHQQESEEVSGLRNAASINAAPIHDAPIHAVPALQLQQSVPVSHAPIPIEHAKIQAHDSHDEPIDYYAYPKYQYEYKVEDPHTGDNKFQHEYRDGDVVKGMYGLHEADGSVRIVEYSSDKHNGFNAVVKHTAPGQHVQIKTHHQN